MHRVLLPVFTRTYSGYDPPHEHPGQVAIKLLQYFLKSIQFGEPDGCTSPDLFETFGMNAELRNRPESYLYSIQPEQRHLLDAGVTADGTQVLIGLYCPDLVAIFFAGDGSLQEVRKRPLPFDAVSIFDERISTQLGEWKKELTFRPRVISVKRFFVLEKTIPTPENAWHRDGIGIVEISPPHFHAMLANPDIYTTEDLEFVQKQIPEWWASGQFVLWWGNDYWLDNTGEIVSS